MPKKRIRKHKAHQKMCLDQVRKGLMNRADGGWTKAEGRMGADMMAGYKVR